MDAGAMDASGRSTTNAGRICGIIGTVLLVLSLVAGCLFFLVGLGAAFSHHG